MDDDGCAVHVRSVRGVELLVRVRDRVRDRVRVRVRDRDRVRVKVRVSPPTAQGQRVLVVTWRAIAVRDGSWWFLIMVVCDHGGLGSWWFVIMVVSNHGG